MSIDSYSSSRSVNQPETNPYTKLKNRLKDVVSLYQIRLLADIVHFKYAHT